MNFEFSEAQIAIRDAINKLCAKYGPEYWLARDEDGRFPEEFVKDLADGGWLGITMPPELGGSGLGVTEAALMMQTIARTGAGFSGCSAIHINLFGPMPVVVYGTEEQKRRMLPPMMQGKDRTCFGVTEPDAGLDTSKVKTRAVKDGRHYIVHGQKIWTSTAQTATKILLLARTKPLEDCKSGFDGLSLFFTDFDRKHVEVREIHKMGRKAVDSNQVFFDGMKVPEEDLIGKEGEGFKYLLHGLNPERILIAAEATGLGQAALARATQYAKDRVVFGHAIGENQGIQHPLAVNWIELEAAELLTYKAASLYDAKLPCGPEANAAKYFAAEAGFKACTQAVMTHGGMGYAKEFHVERMMRESMIARIAPVSRELVLSHVAEKALGLPKSY